MLFSSIPFIFGFLPVFLLVYYIAPLQYRNIVLLLGSLWFYALGEWKYLPLLLFTLVLNDVLVRRLWARSEIVKNGMVLFLLTYDFGILFGFKYLSGVIPLGISFYTFQIAAYVLDVYWGKCQPSRNIIETGTYLCMYPQLIAGPILIYKDMIDQIRSRRCTLNKIEEGLKIFVLGLASKLLLADVLGTLWHQIQVTGFESISTPMAWLGAAAFSMEIYFDFHGYSLMAVGLGKMLGFSFAGNFDVPYMSKSVSEFFRRWHISLGQWFREYVYIPLGGNRKGTGKTIRNLFIVWLFTGLWHGKGWNFIAWAMGIFCLVVLERLGLKAFLQRHRVLTRCYMILFILISWVVFAVSDWKELVIYLQKMFPAGQTRDFIAGNGKDAMMALRQYGVLLLAATAASTGIFGKVYERYKNRWWLLILLLALFWLCVIHMIKNEQNPFLYFRF